MKVVVRTAPRWPGVPLWALLFVALWALVVVTARLVSAWTGTELDTCLFHRFTGLPCPTCGTTRGLLALARGAWGVSWRWNPLTMTGFAVAGLLLLGRLATGRMLEVRLTQPERRCLTALGLVLLALNWAWLIHSQR